MVNIEQVHHTKFLGVIMNDRLNWNDHIKMVCTKVNKNTGILYRTRKNLNTNTLLLLYQTLIQAYLEYCNIIWSVDDSDFLQILLIKQKKAVRAINFGKWNCHTAQICASLQILSLYNINNCQSCSFVYKSLNNLLPSQFSNFFYSNKDLHDHNTRHKKYSSNILSH